MDRYVCIHGHFYQPPRENPWLEEIELQDSAHPYHDWNERISAECYAPNAASRILDAESRIVGIVNNYAGISFNFGPTLLSWLERREPNVYRAILDADRESLKRFGGHGSAIAQVYNHLIMPLANERDKKTQIEWGVEDFIHRFGRDPEGIWLSETAADTATFEAVAEAGISFTILSPFQARRMRAVGSTEWNDAGGGAIDPRVPYLVRLPSGRSIAVFFYDGTISHEVSFGSLLRDGTQFASRLISAFSDSPERAAEQDTSAEAESPAPPDRSAELVSIATDGETFGHHRRDGDMALAYCLYHIEKERLAEITVFGRYLELHPPVHEVEIHEPSSWSCGHGVGRWRTDCGCSSGLRPDWNQRWREPLREALDRLRDSLEPLYEKAASNYLPDPWAARGGYIRLVLDRSPESEEAFFARYAARRLTREERLEAIRLLEMERQLLLMYTSCGWFFDEISGIETVQILQYAARAIQLARDEIGVMLEPAFLRMLARAPSNLPELGDGAAVYERYVKPSSVDLSRVAIHYAISSLFESVPDRTGIYCYDAERLAWERIPSGKFTLVLGRVKIVSSVVGEEGTFDLCVLHLGDHSVHAGILGRESETGFPTERELFVGAFGAGDIPEVVRLIDRFCGENTYSFKDLFRDRQRTLLTRIMEPTVRSLEEVFLQAYRDQYAVMLAMHEMQVPMPAVFSTISRFVANKRLKRLLADETPDLEAMTALVEEIGRFGPPLDEVSISFAAGRRISALMESIVEDPASVERTRLLTRLLRLLRSVPVQLDLWKAQNLYFSMCGAFRPADAAGWNREWLQAFDELGTELAVRCERPAPGDADRSAVSEQLQPDSAPESVEASVGSSGSGGVERTAELPEVPDA